MSGFGRFKINSLADGNKSQSVLPSLLSIPKLKKNLERSKYFLCFMAFQVSQETPE